MKRERDGGKYREARIRCVVNGSLEENGHLCANAIRVGKFQIFGCPAALYRCVKVGGRLC